MGDMKPKPEQTRRMARDLINIYYELVNKTRHVISTLYMDVSTGLVSWNTKGVTENKNTLKFIIDLPAHHSRSKLGSQRILGSAVNGQLTFVIQVRGIVIGQDKSPNIFLQKFIATARGNKWKIVSSYFNLQEPLHRKN